MTAFLFIPAIAGSRDARRVDLGNIATLFSESEEPARREPAGRTMLRAAATALLLLLAIGDTVLVMRPAALGGCPAPRPVSRLTL